MTIKEIYKNTLEALFNNDKGFSSRKLLALASFWTAFELAQVLEGDNRLYAVYAFLAVGLLSLSIVTVANLIELKNGSNNPNTPS